MIDETSAATGIDVRQQHHLEPVRLYHLVIRGLSEHVEDHRQGTRWWVLDGVRNARGGSEW